MILCTRWLAPAAFAVTACVTTPTGKEGCLNGEPRSSRYRDTWRIAKLGAKTDGHDESLVTHTFATTGQSVDCQPRGEVDFGQTWPGLRVPEPFAVRTPRFDVDLPARERKGLDDRNPGHIRHRLTPVGDMNVANEVWVFQLPGEIVADHNDIFGYEATTLLLALMQVSGSVLSLASDWRDSFE